MARRKDVVEVVVLFYPSAVEGRWVAHCLNWDLIGTGAEPDEAFKELLGTIEVYWREFVEMGPEAVLPSPAPGRFWEAAERATQLPGEFVAGLTGWADRWAEKRRRRLRGILPKRARAAIVTDAPELALVCP
jgi:hypothetical protein